MARVSTVIPLDKLEQEIKQILDEYAGQVQENMAFIVKEVARVGTNDLRINARQKIGGKRRKYANGFRYQVQGHRLYTDAVIYQSAVPGLPHLLEKGHVTRNGDGRVYEPTPAHPHIKEIEEKIITEFEQKVKATL